MKAVTHGHIDPNDIVRGTFSGQQAYPIPVVGIPLKWEAVGGEHVEINGYRLIVDDHVFFGQRHIVHHRHTRQRHVNRLTHFAIGAHHHVLNMIHPLGPRINHGMHLPGHRINFGMCGKRPGQRAFKVVSTNGFQLVGKFYRRASRLNHGPGFAGKRAHIGIRTTHRIVPVGPRNIWLPSEAAQLFGTNETIAIPLGLAFPQSNAMHHSRTDKPMMIGLSTLTERVRAIPQIATV